MLSQTKCTRPPLTRTAPYQDNYKGQDKDKDQDKNPGVREVVAMRGVQNATPGSSFASAMSDA